MVDGDATSVRPPDAQELPRVSGKFMVIYALATLGVYLAMLTPATVSLSVRIAQIDPRSAAGDLSVIASIGGVFALIGNPLFGRFSDRCRSRFGRRRPFILGGLLAAIPAVVVVGAWPNLLAMTIAWCCAQLAIAAALAATTAVLADQVPVIQRGRMSGLVQIGIYLATLLGTFLAQLTPTRPVLMFLIPGVLAVILATPLLLRLPDPVPPVRAIPERATVRQWLASIWVSPRRHPDFGWAWLSRLFVYMGAYVVTTFLTLLAIDRLHVGSAEAAHAVFLGNLVYTGAVVVSALGSGWASDRTYRRKPFVVAAAALFGAGVLVLAFSTSLSALLVGMLIAGLGMGTYASIDLALLTGVLPHRGAEDAKDMGLFQVAIALANAVVPAVGAGFLALGGGANFTALFCASSAFSVLGAVLVLPIKSVR